MNTVANFSYQLYKNIQYRTRIARKLMSPFVFHTINVKKIFFCGKVFLKWNVTHGDKMDLFAVRFVGILCIYYFFLPRVHFSLYWWRFWIGLILEQVYVHEHDEQVIIQKFTLNRGRCVWQLLPSTVEVLLCRGSHDWPFLVTGQCWSGSSTNCQGSILEHLYENYFFKLWHFYHV